MSDQPPNIVIDGRMILPVMTGAGRYLLGLCKGLNDLPGDEQIELWLQSGLPKEHPAWRLSEGRIRLRSLPAAHFSLSSQWSIPANLRWWHPDLLHYPHFDLPWLAYERVVATIYDTKYIAHPDFFSNLPRLRSLVVRGLTRHTIKRSSRVIVPSQSTAIDLVDRLKAEEEKLRVIPLGVDECFFAPVKDNEITRIRASYGLKAPFVLFAGERRPHKNLEGLICTFNIFRHQVSKDYHLVIAGHLYSGYNQPEAAAQNLGLMDCVHFLDNVPDPDLIALYHAADAFILLSKYEGFGLPVLEAMACGTPVLVSNVTSLPEVTGEAGLQVPPDNPELAAEMLLKVIPGGEDREKYIASGLERAQRFTWKRCAEQTLQVYREVLKA